MTIIIIPSIIINRRVWYRYIFNVTRIIPSIIINMIFVWHRFMFRVSRIISSIIINMMVDLNIYKSMITRCIHCMFPWLLCCIAIFSGVSGLFSVGSHVLLELSGLLPRILIITKIIIIIITINTITITIISP